LQLPGRWFDLPTFYHKPDGNTVETRLRGYLTFEPATGKVRALRLITQDATYGGGKFAIAVRSE
jgi:hypothetical protein